MLSLKLFLCKNFELFIHLGSVFLSLFFSLLFISNMQTTASSHLFAQRCRVCSIILFFLKFAYSEVLSFN